MRLIWAVLCQDHSIDKDTNNISLFRILETVKVGVQLPSVPVADEPYPLPCELVTLWIRDELDVPEEADMRVVIRVDDRDAVTGDAVQVNLKDYQRHRHIHRYQGLPMPGPLTVGQRILKFVVETPKADSWEDCAVVPLVVVTQEASMGNGE